MSRRVAINAWGTWARYHKLPAYAMQRDDGYETKAAAIARAIAAKFGFNVVALKHEGWALGKEGCYQSSIYQATIGSPRSGYALVWFSIEAEQEEIDV